MRVHEAAKTLEKDSKELITILKELGVAVKSHMSSITEEDFAKLEARVMGNSVKSQDSSPKEKTEPKVKEESKKPEPKEESKPETEKIEEKVEEMKKAEIVSTVEDEKEEVVEEVVEEVELPAEPAAQEEEVIPAEEIEISKSITVSEFASKLEIKATELIKKLMSMGVWATMNQILSEEEVHIVAEEYNKTIKFKDLYGDDIFAETETDDEKDLKPRIPIVTIMGHVDHGKTSLLDSIRESNLADKEKGGITQTIGAYMVKAEHGNIVFIDTPGHKAFTAMRARGAKVTDIVILIVAADDGVMPQTVEAIDHAKAAGAPIIVAINKIDKEGAQPEKVKQELTKYNLVPEEWGGKTQMVSISAKQGTGIDALLEAILLEAEMLDLKTNTDCKAQGIIIEAKLDKGRGAVATALIHKGTLKVGDAFLTNYTFGKVRAILDDHGNRIKEAKAVMPVELLGFEEVPNAGDKFKVFDNEKEVRQIALKRVGDIKRFAEEKKKKKLTLEDLHKKIEHGAEKKLPLIIKGDSIGSVEALSDAINKLSQDHDIQVQIVHKDVGEITESDVVLADASNAIIIGFFVATNPAAKELAAAEGVEIKIYHIIYEVVDSIKAAMEGLLEPEYEEVKIGEAEVRQVFHISSEETVIAGCYLHKGKVYHDSIASVVRKGYEVMRKEISTLKRFKDNVKEVKEGYECGVVIEKYNDIQEGDQIFFYEMHQKLRKL